MNDSAAVEPNNVRTTNVNDGSSSVKWLDIRIAASPHQEKQEDTASKTLHSTRPVVVVANGAASSVQIVYDDFPGQRSLGR